MALTTFTSGTKAQASQVNSNFSLVYNNVLLNYTSTAFNASQTGTGTTTNSYEPSAIASSSLTGKDYVVIMATITGYSYCAGGGSGSASLKLESKNVGGSYGTDYDVTVSGASYDADGNTSTQTIIFYHTLTAGEKSDGLQLKFTGTAVGSSGGGSITNVQVIVVAV